MANIKAIIKKKNKNNQDTNVYISYYRNSKEKAILSAGVKCNPSDWNPEKEEIRKSDPLHKEKNELIGRRKQRVIAVQNEYELQDRELSIDQLKASYNEWLKGSDKIKDPIQAIEFMIERKQGLVKKDVIKDYNALSKHLSHFIRSNAPHAQLVDIDNEFGMRFEQFLYTEKLVPFKDTEKNKLSFRPMAKSTVGKQLKNLKVLIRFCLDTALIKENRLTKLSTPSEVSDSIALSAEELDKIEQLPLEVDSKTDQIRDLFLIGCEVGLRYADLSRLRSDHLDKDQRIISIKTSKSTKPIKIPVSQRVKRILGKRSGHFPQAYNSNFFNKEIKEIAKNAGLIYLTIKSITRGGKLTEETLPQYKLIASHTCRRTFCTIQFKRGMPSILIRKVSGHSKEEDFLRYIKIEEEEAAEMMLTYWSKK